MISPVVCIVTIHGVGFEQPPQPDLGIPGYADGLHQHLSICLGATLGDDPQRTRQQKGENGPIYVQSCWPPASGNREQGLARLGSWSGPQMQRVDTTNAPLAANGEHIAHVALVYSHLEGQGPEIGATMLTGAMSLVSASHYTNVAGLMHLFFADSLALVEQRLPPRKAPPATNLHVRTDPGFKPVTPLIPHGKSVPTGLLAVLRNLENDVAAYVSHNELRERVRSFVLDAILRLAYRDDVEGIIINSHSNGTVIALDVIRQLSPFAAARIKAFITAGSPLRKYIDLFRWGQELENTNPITPWLNFWDEHDPVADPLEPPVTWHRGEAIPAHCDPKLFLLIDPNSGNTSNIEVSDIQVDNLKYSYSGGLPAHNYWDNEEEFVKSLTDTVHSILNQ